MRIGSDTIGSLIIRLIFNGSFVLPNGKLINSRFASSPRYLQSPSFEIFSVTSSHIQRLLSRFVISSWCDAKNTYFQIPSARGIILDNYEVKALDSVILALLPLSFDDRLNIMGGLFKSKLVLTASTTCLEIRSFGA